MSIDVTADSSEEKSEDESEDGFEDEVHDPLGEGFDLCSEDEDEDETVYGTSDEDENGDGDCAEEDEEEDEEEDDEDEDEEEEEEDEGKEREEEKGSNSTGLQEPTHEVQSCTSCTFPCSKRTPCRWDPCHILFTHPGGARLNLLIEGETYDNILARSVHPRGCQGCLACGFDDAPRAKRLRK